MRLLLVIFLLLQAALHGQDKVFLKSGKRLNGIVVSVTNDLVYFRTSDTSAIQQLKRKEILMIDAVRGTRYIFGTDESLNAKPSFVARQLKRNSLGMQPLGIFSGRITFAYERLNKAGKVGVLIPLSLSFDPFGPIFSTRIDTSTTIERIEGVKIITGVDLNFYITENENARLFIGPRIRYGTDLLLGNLEGYTIQTQIGYRFGKPQKLISQHISMGFGIARVLTPPAGSLLSTDQFYSWFSVNYRIGVNW